MTGEVTLEKRVTHCHILYAYCPFPVIDLDDTVDQQERISMWNDLLNLPGVKQRELLRWSNGVHTRELDGVYACEISGVNRGSLTRGAGVS